MARTMYINSYYGTADGMSNQGNYKDGMYYVTYADDIDLKKEITEAYNKLNQDENLVTDLGEVLNYLKNDGSKYRKVISYVCIKAESFDCDYGSFDS